MIVPIPTVPPRAKPMPVKIRSTITRTIPKGFFNLSLRTTATKSFGPVPASDLMTIVIPNARITQPMKLTAMRTIRETSPAKSGPSKSVKKSMIGPPQNMQMTVPIPM